MGNTVYNSLLIDGCVGERTKAIDAHRVFLERRGPEAAWNGVVLLRELRTQGFTHRKGCVEVASSQPPSAPYESPQGRRQSTHHHP